MGVKKMSKDRRIVILLSPEDHAKVAGYAASRRMSMSGIARIALLEEVDRKARLTAPAVSPKKEKSADDIPVGKRTFDQLSDRGKRVAIRLVWCERFYGYMPGTDIGKEALEEARKWLPPGNAEPPRDQADVPHFWEV